MAELTALVLANMTDADTGYIGERLVQRGYALRMAMRDRGEIPADIDGVDVVLLLGSEWSVHSPADPVALEAECEMVRTASAAGVPVLGLCYGAQVLAHAFGGRVSLAGQPEVGFIGITSDDEELVPSGAWPQFHLDVVHAPPDAQIIARNDCGTQAFMLPGILGVQFHPEVRPDILDDWSRRFPELLVDTGVDREALIAQSRQREPAARAAAHALVDAFLDRVAAQSGRSSSKP